MSAMLKENELHGYSEQKKPKIMTKRLPRDFFQESFSLKLRNSVDLSSRVQKNPQTPSFGRRKLLNLSVRRQAVTAMENKPQEDSQCDLIKDIIYSSRNIHRLRRKSVEIRQKHPEIEEPSLIHYRLPSISTRKCPRF